jgi:long-subunit fatty acid transport protein
MKHTYRTAGAVLLLAVCIGQLQAQKVGTSSLQFLKVMPTARATAMGDAYVSLASGADATFWNPAGLTKLETHELSSTLTMWLFDTKQLALAYGLPMGDWGTLGFQFQYVDFGRIEETRADAVDLVVPANGTPFFNAGLTGRSFTPYSYLVGLSYARAFTDKFSAALTAKYVMESLWSEQAITIVNPVTGEASTYKTYADVVLYDFGMLYNTGFRSIQIGISAQNFGPQVKFADAAHPAPLAFRLGVSANLLGQEGLLFQDGTNRFTLAYDLFQPNDYRQQMHVGAEYSFLEFVALRAGYKIDYDSEGLTFGGGLHTDVSGWPVRVDYSYGKMSEYLNNVHRISLGVQFR